MRATTIISAPWVVPVVSPPIPDGAVALDGDRRVVAVGPRREITAAWPGLPEDRGQGALLPGLVNAHTHLELAHVAGAVPGGAGLVSWVGNLLSVAHPGSPEAQAAGGAPPRSRTC
jgi:cytosine/adenosine deaminase-related metal-dependent hydrolase